MQSSSNQGTHITRRFFSSEVRPWFSKTISESSDWWSVKKQHPSVSDTAGSKSQYTLQCLVPFEKPRYRPRAAALLQKLCLRQHQSTRQQMTSVTTPTSENTENSFRTDKLNDKISRDGKQISTLSLETAINRSQHIEYKTSTLWYWSMAGVWLSALMLKEVENLHKRKIENRVKIQRAEVRNHQCWDEIQMKKIRKKPNPRGVILAWTFCRLTNCSSL